MAYIFVAAALLAVIPIVVIFKMNLEKIRENPEQLNKVQTNFFIGLAISEMIPLILIVYGLMDATKVNSIEELYAPSIIILLLMAVSVFFMDLQKRIDVESESKKAINKFAMIAIPLVIVIPLVSLIGLFSMVP
ncbi:hypothetical protein SAMN04488072_11287 [Lentibacillus halodurans]|uniref:Uncharacterized protein n=1 Tax=Lentibacillus halodurans TaxID=237679 RepID=A0A1I0ZN70_9BACI|nr:hypothetical protein [Lentibacillus halodurans]SFB27085.1 hypothetical protein SAMN04488072_11287 [Lentibacillus halodurans]